MIDKLKEVLKEYQDMNCNIPYCCRECELHEDTDLLCHDGDEMLPVQACWALDSLCKLLEVE